jgi:HPt (histidine-containing phosphotransfer) domain-containing protein
MNALGQLQAPVERGVTGHWDRTALLRQVDGDRELAGELVSIFLEDEPAMRAELQDAMRAESADSLAHVAHAYKGSAAAVGGVLAAEAASALEAAGRAGRVSVWFEWRRFEDLANRLVEELSAFGDS